MRNLKSLLMIAVVSMMAMAAVSISAQETVQASNRAIFTKPLIWRADQSADYSFKGAAFSGTEIAANGVVISSSTEGTCELPNPYKTDAPITSLTANWSFTGKVTLEVSVTGNSRDYMKVTNGVPAHYRESAQGNRIKWKATLAPNSSLTDLKIVYSDLSGVVGSFGNELLSGFSTRRQVYIKGSKAGEVFNYQMLIKVGESEKPAVPCDIKLNAGIISDFADIRFTQADGETLIPHYLEEVTGKAPDRIAYFWIRMPEIPKDGLPIYMYYGKAAALDLSDADKVFDFFDDFNGTVLNPKKWKITLYDKEGTADVADSILSLKSARVTSLDYKFASGLIEYKAGSSANGQATAIVRAGQSESDDLAASSSPLETLAHAIAKGASIRVNDTRPITAGAFYAYRIYCDDTGIMAFRRYDESGIGLPQASSQYSAGPAPAMPIGLSSSGAGKEMYCKWIRVRQAVYPPPRVDDIGSFAGATETTNLPEFYNVSTAPNGSLIAAPNTSGGYYLSRIISPGFEVRILKPYIAARSAGDDLTGISISTKAGGKFYAGWENGKTRYVSKKEFDKGSQLKWKADFGAEGASSVIVRRPQADEAISSFALEFYSGFIRVILPNGGEAIAPGTKYSIFWSAEGYGKDYPMEISYSGPGKRQFKAIASKVNNSGDYSWDVPSKASGEAVVKVADYNDKNVYGISEECFYITTSASGEKTAGSEVTASTGAIITPPAAVTAPSEDKTAEEIKKDEKKSLAGFYDLLIKVGDGASGSGYKDGDIVMVKPAGYIWGAEEKSKFLVVRARLTPARAEELMKPDEVTTAIGRSNSKTVKMINRRKYRINMQDKISLQDRAMASHGRLNRDPVEVADIAAATEKKR